MNGALYIVMVTGVVGVIIVTLGTYAVLGIRDGFNRALRDLHEHDAGPTKRRKQLTLPLFSSGDPGLSYEAERETRRDT